MLKRATRQILHAGKFFGPRSATLIKHTLKTPEVFRLILHFFDLWDVTTVGYIHILMGTREGAVTKRKEGKRDFLYILLLASFLRSGQAAMISSACAPH